MLPRKRHKEESGATLTINVNGISQQVDVEDGVPLLWVIRDTLNMTGTKYGCGVGACGACTVLIDGVATRSCSFPAVLAAGKNVMTIEGLKTGVAEEKVLLNPNPS